MAVTKIRRTSSWTLLVVSIISIIVLGMFYMGGVVDQAADMKEPVNTGLLINWMYILFGITIVCAIVFALWQFVSLLKTDAKSALMSLVVVVLFAALLFITYSIGDGTPLKMLNSDSAKYNVSFWLKITDMWIYSSYALISLIIIAVAVGAVKKVLDK